MAAKAGAQVTVSAQPACPSPQPPPVLLACRRSKRYRLQPYSCQVVCGSKEGLYSHALNQVLCCCDECAQGGSSNGGGSNSSISTPAEGVGSPPVSSPPSAATWSCAGFIARGPGLLSIGPQGLQPARGQWCVEAPCLQWPTVSCRGRVRVEATVRGGTSLTGGVIAIEAGRTGGGCNQSTLRPRSCRLPVRMPE